MQHTFKDANEAIQFFADQVSALSDRVAVAEAGILASHHLLWNLRTYLVGTNVIDEPTFNSVFRNSAERMRAAGERATGDKRLYDVVADAMEKMAENAPSTPFPFRVIDGGKADPS